MYLCIYLSIYLSIPISAFPAVIGIEPNKLEWRAGRESLQRCFTSTQAQNKPDIDSKLTCMNLLRYNQFEKKSEIVELYMRPN